MVHDEVWLRAMKTSKGLLCLRCLRRRLERELTISDFTSAPINNKFRKDPMALWRC